MSIDQIMDYVERYGNACRKIEHFTVEGDIHDMIMQSRRRVMQDHWNKRADSLLKLIKEELEYIILEYQTQINERD